MTDYLALIHRFAADGVIGEMDCVYSSWATDAPDGFGDGRCRGAAAARAVAGAGDQMRVARPHRRRPWSRPISAATPAGAC